MKVHVYKNTNRDYAPLDFYDNKQDTLSKHWQYLGEMEIEPKLPKKVVTKEVKADGIGCYWNKELQIWHRLPEDAKNIKSAIRNGGIKYDGLWLYFIRNKSVFNLSE